jgi:hypothetical protein
LEKGDLTGGMKEVEERKGEDNKEKGKEVEKGDKKKIKRKK